MRSRRQGPAVASTVAAANALDRAPLAASIAAVARRLLGTARRLAFNEAGYDFGIAANRLAPLGFLPRPAHQSGSPPITALKSFGKPKNCPGT